MTIALIVPLEPTALQLWPHAFYKFCLSHAPSSPYSYFYSSLVCGSPLPQGPLKTALINSSLLHLFVVSGSHLLFLEFFLSLTLKKIRYGGVISAFILCLYGMMTDLQAPVLRALAYFGFCHLNKVKKMFWRSHTISLFAGTFCIALVPLWSSSYSLLLSWTTSLIIGVVGDHTKKDHVLLRCAMIYFFVIPILLTFNCPMPISIIFNAIAAPFLGFCLFPLSLISFFLPISFFSDALVSLLIKMLVLFDEPSNTATAISIPIPFLWSYLLSLHAIAHFLSVRTKSQ
jgi:ComEC/Rec2-related protein